MSRGTRADKSARSGGFILGQRAFRKINAIEGIELSKRLEADLIRLKNMPPEERRAILAEKYGKKE